MMTLRLYDNIMNVLKMRKMKFLTPNFKLCTLLIIASHLDWHATYKNDKSRLLMPAALTQEKLWSIQKSWHMFDKSLDPEIPEIYNEKLLVSLISQAWQWDKNAMIQYARIESMARDKSFIRNFYRKNAHRIIDHYGFRLKRPEIFDMDYSDFILKLAELRHPLAANLATGKIRWSAGSSYFKHNALDSENHASLIKYMRYSINGGYHEYSYLADSIIFASSFAFKDTNVGELNSLQDRIPTLTDLELKESFEAYKKSALHNSQYAQIRISEYYFHGVGIEKNLERAWAWALLARENNLQYKKIYTGKFHSKKEKEDKYNDYNLELLSKMEKYLTKAQQSRGAELVAEIKASIVTEDYYQWESEIDPIPPMP